MMNKFKLLAFGVVLALLNVSCLFDTAPGKHSGADQSEVSISMVVPNDVRSGSRALLPTDEAEVRNVEILVFDVDGVLRDRAAGVDIQHVSVTEGVAVKRFKATLNKAVNSTLMLLLNSREAIDEFDPQIGVSTIAQVTAGLKVAIPATGWSHNTADSGYRPIPMWGVKKHVTIDKNLALEGNSGVRVVRMLASVNVVLGNAVTSTDFILGGVHLYNSNSHAQVVPNDANGTWASERPQASAPSLPAGVSINPPINYEIPNAHTTLASALTGTIYMAETKAGVSLDSTTGDFFKNPCVIIGGYYNGSPRMTYYRVDIGEAVLRNHRYNIEIRSVAGPGKNTPDDALNSIPENIEFGIVKWDEGGHQVVVFDGVNVLGISQAVYNLPADATTSKDKENIIKIKTDVKPVGTTPGGWKAEFFRDRDGASPLADNWIVMKDSPSGTGSYSTGGDNRRFELLENTTGQDRKAFVHISAGRLTYVVEVTQSALPRFSLEIMRNEDFAYGAGGKEYGEKSHLNVRPDVPGVSMGYDMMVRWRPADATVRYRIREAVTPNSMNYNLQSNINLPDGGLVYSHVNGTYQDILHSKTYNNISAGERYFDIKAVPLNDSNNPFAERSATLDVELVAESGLISRSLEIRQCKNNIRLDNAEFYLMDGKENKILVRSNFPWRAQIALGGDPKGVVQKFGVKDGEQFGGGNGYCENELLLTLIDNIHATPIDLNKLDVTIQISFERLDEASKWVPWNDWQTNGMEGTSPKLYNIRCLSAVPVPPANSYMVKPGGVPIMIPLSIINDAKTKYGVTTMSSYARFEPQFLWSDHPSGVIQKMIEVKSGQGYNGHLIVIPGTTEGSAVVGVNNLGSRKLAWSWHIWNTKYDPDKQTDGCTYDWNGRTFMDRNLGAGRAVPDGDPDIYGFHYQHGRKDPFPGVDPINTGYGQLIVPIYDNNGSVLPYGTTGIKPHRGEPVPGSTNAVDGLEQSIYDPMTYYGSDSAEGQWIGTGKQDWTWWGHNGTKGLFDPCPPGWRVPDSDGTNAGGLTAGGYPMYGLNLSYVSDAPNYLMISTIRDLGYWPRPGFLHTNWITPQINEFGKGHYWMAGNNNAVQTCGAKFEWNSGMGLMGDVAGDDTDFAFSIRCVKE